MSTSSHEGITVSRLTPLGNWETVQNIFPDIGQQATKDCDP